MKTLPPGWEATTLATVVELQRGFDLPHHARRPGLFPVLTSGETGGTHEEGPIEGPGFVVGRATNLGKPKWSDTDFWPHNTTMFAKDFKGNDPRWLFHLFEYTDLSGYDSGSVQPMLNRNYIAAVSVLRPPLPEQQAIAEVLGALDEKIAANTRLAATADEYARTQFAELAQTTHRGSLTYDSVAIVSGGGTPSTKTPDFWGGDINWATPTDVTGLVAPYLWSTERKITKSGLESCASSLHPAGAILMTSRATIGAFALAQQPTAVNQGFITVQTRGSIPQMWLFHEMRHRVSEYLSWANGATFLELSRGNFKKLPVMLSDDSTMRGFADAASDLHKVASQLTEQNRTLASTRDALLPKLMSGQLRVRDAEATVAEVL